ncbi:hypothetical protein [Leptospira interrogans]|uniref:Uncharacterized protein n=16 Tax=Leptospira interrogans TaxID=173 RepID=M3I115_LEPIT|nr:hypothetical protein [Leptospira interrogans]EMG23796.1 hypothetical protein LEP1GSC150_2860 [Leptospira interrogans serovar Copenhageni str. LT2050]ARB96938.1 hypothetical protein A6J42_16905 [Leptospira interrogans serovar Copenhageni]ASP41744.1 hypothetical protein AMR47_07415 [Leptospira interrogans]KPA29254.1 Uncharacterized protein AMR48_1155 [Leptospira interrogans]KPA30047.1 Uncharacterized protein AMR48_0717 [Leptospira interrogans]
MATTPGRNLRRFQVRQLYISLIAGYILLKKNNQVRVKPKKQERSRVSSWPFLFQERSFKTFDQQTTVLRSVKEKPGINVWLFCVLRGGCVYTKGIPVQRT